MSEINFENNDADDEFVMFEELNTEEIFSFLKSYHNDLFPEYQSGNKTVREGVYFETIVALEKLHRNLQDVGDFIGYAKGDWDEACLNKNNYKKNEIVSFYNDLVIDVQLMKLANMYYCFSPKVRAFIHFLEERRSSVLFIQDAQKEPWNIDDFPHNEIFQSINDFRLFYRANLKNYQQRDDFSNARESVLKIQNAIRSAKKTTQFIFLFKFDVLKFTNEELADLISKVDLNPDLANLTRNQKLQIMVTWLSSQIFGEGLPWLCQIAKAELNINQYVKLQIGLILDSSNQKNTSDIVARSLTSQIKNLLDRSGLRSFVAIDMVQIDQIFNHIGPGGIREIKLPNMKKTALMLKWYMGVFYRVNEFIRPSNIEIESKFYEGEVCLEINSRYVERLERNDQTTRKRTNFKKESRKPKEVDFLAIWNEKALLKQLPDYFSSIHRFYEGLEYSEGLSRDEIQILQRLSLFVAYLSENNLDGLYDRLLMSKHPKHWPAVVQMFLSFPYKSLGGLFDLKQWVYVDLPTILKQFINNPKFGAIKRNIDSSESMKDIVEIVTDLQKVVRQSGRFQRIRHAVKLVRKNSRLAHDYLNKSFKQNAVVLRFQVDNRESKLDLNALKQVFTQFIKRVGRAPKRIGADLDSYMGYFVSDRENYSIDFTAILYDSNEDPDSVPEAMQDDSHRVLEAMQDEWKKFISVYIQGLTDERLKTDCANLKFEAIPTLWSPDNRGFFLVLNKGDKITNQIKKDLVTFYTAYEFFNGGVNIKDERGRRPELFLRGRTRMSVAKSSEKKEPQQKVNDVQIHEEDSVTDDADQNLESVADNKIVNIEVENIEPKNEEKLVSDDERQRQEEWERIDKMRKERIAAFVKTIQPLV